MTHGKLAAIVIAITSALAQPAFASGYGPSPYYQPADGAPVSQRGMSMQSLAADDSLGRMNEMNTAKATQQDIAETILTAGDKH
jgi:hypothetical protein